MSRFRRPKRSDLSPLEAFAAKHEGVEAYMEPKTATMPQSLLFVARDGEWARAPAPDRGQAAQLCKKLMIPFYDAAIIGYPERMRGMKGKPAPAAPSAKELEEWFSNEAQPPQGDSG